MDDGIVGELAIWTLALFISALVTCAEASLTATEPLSVKQKGREGVSSSLAVEALSSNPALFLSGLAVLRILAHVIAAGAAVLLAWSLWPKTVPVIGALAVTALALILVQVIAHRLATCVLERTDSWLYGPIRFVAYLLLPITLLLRPWGCRISRESGDKELLNDESLHLLLRAGKEQGVIEPEEKEMIASIFELGETLVREVMVPRVDIVAVDVEASFAEVVKAILEAGHSRLPVYQGNIDHVVGLLYARDLLTYLAEGKTDVKISQMLRPAYFIPESKRVDELLQELQQRKVHMAIVVDEYGGTAGLVTIEDLLEEIVGEIQDEYDLEEPVIEEISESEFIFSARVNLDEVNERLHIELPSEGGDTLGGFIYSQLGKVPACGDTISFEGVTLEVISVEGHRIERVRARREAPLPGSDRPGPTASTLLSLLTLR